MLQVNYQTAIYVTILIIIKCTIVHRHYEKSTDHFQQTWGICTFRYECYVTKDHFSSLAAFQCHFSCRMGVSWDHIVWKYCPRGPPKIWLKKRRVKQCKVNCHGVLKQCRGERTKIPTNIKSTVWIQCKRFDVGIYFTGLRTVDVCFVKKS